MKVPIGHDDIIAKLDNDEFEMPILLRGAKGLGKSVIVDYLISDQGVDEDPSRIFRADQVTADVVAELRAFQGTRKSFIKYVSLDITGIRQENANALLKMLEEPATMCCYFLRVTGPVLDTIASRCVSFTLGFFDERSMRKILEGSGMDTNSVNRYSRCKSMQEVRDLQLGENSKASVLSVVRMCSLANLEQIEEATELAVSVSQDWSESYMTNLKEWLVRSLSQNPEVSAGTNAAFVTHELRCANEVRDSVKAVITFYEKLHRSTDPRLKMAAALNMVVGMKI